MRNLKHFSKNLEMPTGGGIGGGGGATPTLKDGGAHWKFCKEPLRDTKILFCGRGLKSFSTPKRYEF